MLSLRPGACRDCGALWLVMIVAAAILLPVAAARAQGAMGVTADPISTSELHGYASRLHLSDQQWQAVERIHDEYKLEFRRLREGEIGELMDSMGKLDGGLPKRETLEDFIKTMDDVNKRIDSIDRRFFDQFVPILSEEQLIALPRARLARERARYGQQQMMAMAGSRPADLSAILLEFEFDPAERERVDSILVPYESRLTSDLSDLANSAGRIWLNLYDGMIERGFTEEMMNDPEQQKEMMASVEEVFLVAAAPMIKTAGEISDRNARTYRMLRATMTPVHASRLRRAYLTQAYPYAGDLYRLDEHIFDRFLKSADLSDEQRAAADSLIAAARTDLDRITDSAMKVIDESRKGQTVFSPGRGTEQMKERLGELRVQGVTRLRQTGDALASIIGDDRLLRALRSGSADLDLSGLQKIVASASKGSETQPAAGAKAEPDPKVLDLKRADMFVPGPMTQADFKRITRRLALDDGEQAIAAELQRRYREAYDTFRKSELGGLQASVSQMWAKDPKTGTSRGFSDAASDDLLRRRRSGFSAVAQLDDELFVDLALTFDSEPRIAALDRLRLDRRRETYNVPMRVLNMFDQYGTAEPLIDLSRLVDRIEPVSQRSPELEAALVAYEHRLTDLLAARFDVALKAQQAMDRWTATTMRMKSSEDTTATDWSALYKDLLGDASVRAAAANDAILEFNREWQPKIAAALPDEDAMRLNDHYRRAAYPSVFGASDQVTDRLAAAHALPDLTDSQRQSLGEMSLEHRPALDALNDRLVQEIRSAPRMNWLNTGEDFDWQTYQEHQGRIQQVHFDLNELTERATARLGRILNEDQLARVGTKPPKRTKMNKKGS